MSTSTQVESSMTDTIIDIPEEHIENGKTLLIEEYFELFVDGYHLSKPSRYIKHVHHLCLLDTQIQDLKSLTPTHQLKSDIDDNQLVRIVIEFPCEILKNGKSIKIEQSNENLNGPISGNFEDLYNESNGHKLIRIKLASQSFQQGKTIAIEKGNLSIISTDDYDREQKHHLDNNLFSKKDHLKSKNLMQMTIELAPEFFHSGQTVTFRKEDPQTIADNFPYHRSSKPHL